MNGRSTAVAAPPPMLPLSERLRRGFMCALVVGGVAIFASLIPTLFIQSMFSGDLQRCEDARQRGIPMDNLVGCDEEVNVAWLPGVIMLGGSLTGIIGGFTYGFFEAQLKFNQWKTSRERWLPF